MPSRIKELDALRGIAALFVVFFHYTMGRPEAQWGFKLGVTGVDLFFIISGFVIFMSIRKVSSATEFAVNRFTRLYPTYWACATVTFIAQHIGNHWFYHTNNTSTVHYLVNLTMFQHYFKVGDLDGPYWTMILEMVFYICMFFLLLFKQVKNIMSWGLGLLFVIALYCMWLETYYPAINWDFVYWFHLFTHFPLFLAGIVFYRIIHNEGKIYFNYAILVLCFVVQSNLFDNFPKAADFISHTEYMMVLGFYFLLFILFVNHKLGFIVSKPSLFIGKISFALYLIHQFISIDLIIPELLKHGCPFWPAALAALSVSVLLATGITYFIEVPLGKKLNLALRRKLNLPLKHA